MTDLTYTNNGTFVQFIPNTPEGEVVFKQMTWHHSVLGEFNGEFPVSQLRMVLKQLRKAGYSVSKHKYEKISKEEEESIFQALVLDFS